MTDDIRANLRNLRQHMPGEEPVVYDFAAAIADRLAANAPPSSFVLCAHMLLRSLSLNTSCMPLPLPARLVGYVPAIYAALGAMVPSIAKAVAAPGYAVEAARIASEFVEARRS